MLDVHALFEIQLNLEREEEGIVGNDKERVRNDKGSKIREMIDRC